MHYFESAIAVESRLGKAKFRIFFFFNEIGGATSKREVGNFITYFVISFGSLRYNPFKLDKRREREIKETGDGLKHFLNEKNLMNFMPDASSSL